jgi:multicomponent Na+:H+ antiporter subunit G
VIREILGNTLIGAGVLATFLGLLGVLRFHTFSMRLLSTSKIDTSGMMLLILGVIVRSGFTWLSAKALLILMVVLVVNPMVAAKIASSTHWEEERELVEGEPPPAPEDAEE